MSINRNIPIVIRDANEADAPFIFNSWLRSFRQGNLCRGVDNTIYFTEHHKVIERLLKESECKVAVSLEDDRDILGYACYGQIDSVFALHYAYTKHTFRGLGVLRQILKNTNHDFNTAGIHTHSTEIFNRLSLKYNLIYHPYVLINK